MDSGRGTLKTGHNFSIQHRELKKSALQLIVASTFIFLVPNANAVEVGKEIIVTAGVDHDSNPDLVEKNPDPVWIYTIAPQFKLDVKDQVNRWYLDAAVLIQRHSNETVLINREDPRLAIGWDRTYESGMFGLKGTYQESSSRAAELQSKGAFTKIDNTQKDKTLSANWQHNISSRWSVLTEGAYRDVSFTTPGALDNYTLGDISSKLSYANNEKLDTSIQLGYSHLHPEKTFDDTDLVGLTMGANYQVNEKFKIASRAGIYNLSGRQSDTDWLAGIKADYEQERMNYSAELSRGLKASGIGGFQKTDALKLGWLFDISDLHRAGANYSLEKNKEDNDVGLAKLDFQQIGAFYERSLSHHWLARLSASHRQLDASGSTSHANIIGLSVTFDSLNF